MTKIIFKSKNNPSPLSHPSKAHLALSKLNMTQKSKESIDISKCDKNGTGKQQKRRRSRKTYDQMVVLMRYFKHDPTWSRATVQKIKKELGMKTSQIYKWGYDQK